VRARASLLESLVTAGSRGVLQVRYTACNGLRRRPPPEPAPPPFAPPAPWYGRPGRRL